MDPVAVFILGLGIGSVSILLGQAYGRRRHMSAIGRTLIRDRMR